MREFTVKKICILDFFSTFSLIFLTILPLINSAAMLPYSSSQNRMPNFAHILVKQKMNLREKKEFRFRPATDLFYKIDMFGSSYKLQLHQILVASLGFEATHVGKNGTITAIPQSHHQTHCHYVGNVTNCQKSTGFCHSGQAAMSRFAHGLRGIMKIGGEDILIEPLPETLLAKRMRFSNVHIARRKIREESRESQQSRDSEKSDIFDALDQLVNSLKVSETSLDIRSPLANPPDFLHIDVGVFVDTPMVEKLREIYKDEKDQISLILAAYNAVNLLYGDVTIGQIKIKLFVKRVLLDESGDMPKSEKVTEYLNDFCKVYQSNILKKLKIERKNWHLTTALTGLDVYADAVDVTRDAAYRNLRGSAKKIFTVSGVSFGGGMCSIEKNCMVAEFSLLFGNIETMAHETGHTLGMYHDGSGNDCDRKGNKIMSIQRPQRQRSGWSTCSAESLRKFVVSGHASCLINKPIIS